MRWLCACGHGGKLNISLLWKILLDAWILSEIILAIATHRKTSDGKSKDRGSLIVLWVTIPLAITAAGFINGRIQANIFDGAHQLIDLTAFIFLFVGLAIRWTAIISLGKSFTVNVAIHETQTVYQGGLYRLVRHPSYTGMMLAILAVAIAQGNWLSFAVVLVPITAALLYRIHVEEAALNEAFGEQYAQYSLRTKRLIPGIY
jgi:protein-S-isoprenylcysteine O-methyltransferase Ste14